MSKIIADRMMVDDDEMHFRDADAQNKLINLIAQEKGNSETAVMSQAASTMEFDKLSEEIDDRIKVINPVNLFDREKAVVGKYITQGGLDDVASCFITTHIKVDKGAAYTYPIYPDTFGNMVLFYAIYDIDKNFVTHRRSVDNGNGTATITIDETFTDTYGGAYFVAHGKRSSIDSFMVVKGLALPDTYTKYFHPHFVLPDDVLHGKTIVFAGDSICQDSPHNNYGWAGRIGDKYEMTYNNYGRDGAVITTGVVDGGGGAIRSILGWTLPKMITDYPNADYVIFEGGTNDADRIGSILGDEKPEKFGEISADYNAENLDETTFCGAVEKLLYSAINQWMGKKIGFIIAHKMGRTNNTNAENRKAYFDVLIKCCEKWGVPYLNIWESCPLNPNLTTMYNPNNTSDENEENGMMYLDGQHLTVKGYDYITPIIEKWLKTL